jgi:hypothetical protein
MQRACVSSWYTGVWYLARSCVNGIAHRELTYVYCLEGANQDSALADLEGIDSSPFVDVSENLQGPRAHTSAMNRAAARQVCKGRNEHFTYLLDVLYMCIECTV